MTTFPTGLAEPSPYVLLDSSEIEPGLVMFLNPGVLLQRGAAASCGDAYRVTQEHHFVCLARENGHSLWAPLSSSAGTNGTRLLVPQNAKQGHESWTRNNSYLNHGNQTWRGPNEAFIAASRADRSQRFQRNRVVPQLVDAIMDEVRQRGGWTMPSLSPAVSPATEPARAEEPKPETKTYVISALPPLDLEYDQGLYDALVANLAILDSQMEEKRKALLDMRAQLDAQISKMGGAHRRSIAERTTAPPGKVRETIIAFLRQHGRCHVSDVSRAITHVTTSENPMNVAIAILTGPLMNAGIVRRVSQGTYELIPEQETRRRGIWPRSAGR
jgi:hypothetical protein